MSDIVEFQKKLLSDAAFRKRFAENPRAVMDETGISLPEGVKLPSKLDPKVVDQNIDLARAGLEDIGDTLDTINPDSQRDVNRVIEEALPLRKKDILAARQVHEAILGAGGEVATVAVVGAVVAAVVAVPVAVVGVESDLALVSNPALVSVSRGARGLTLHGPNGLRVDGLSAAEAATIIRSFR